MRAKLRLADLCAVRILLIDNYDSFTWNLQHALVSAGGGVEVDVHRNDALVPAGIVGYDGVVVSPGPGIPREAGQTLNAITVAAAHRMPLLGVCLGMQAIAEHFGGTLRNLPDVLHGVATPLTDFAPTGFFAGVPCPTPVGHYHSWVVDDDELPRVLTVTARNLSGLPMALAHATLPIVAVQFHPESVLTPEGPRMLRNWLAHVAAWRAEHPASRAGVAVWNEASLRAEGEG